MLNDPGIHFKVVFIKKADDKCRSTEIWDGALKGFIYKVIALTMFSHKRRAGLSLSSFEVFFPGVD